MDLKTGISTEINNTSNNINILIHSNNFCIRILGCFLSIIKEKYPLIYVWHISGCDSRSRSSFGKIDFVAKYMYVINIAKMWKQYFWKMWTTLRTKVPKMAHGSRPILTSHRVQILVIRQVIDHVYSSYVCYS